MSETAEKKQEMNVTESIGREMGAGVAGAINEFHQRRDEVNDQLPESINSMSYWEKLGDAEKQAIIREARAEEVGKLSQAARKEAEAALEGYAEAVEERRAQLEGKLFDMTNVPADLVARAALASDDELFALVESAGGNKDLLHVIYHQAVRRDNRHLREYIASSSPLVAEYESMPSPEDLARTVSYQRHLLDTELGSR